MAPTTIVEIFKSIIEHKLDDNTCFLCGTPLSVESYSEEHVFPQWLLDKYGIRNTVIHLNNFHSDIKYSEVRVPCCKSCNNEFLSQLEIKIKGALAQGYEGIKTLDLKLLLKWLAKIFLGFFYRKLFINLDKSDPALGNLVDPGLLKKLSLIQIWITCFKHGFDLPLKPGTLKIFKLQTNKPNHFSFSIVSELMSARMIIGDTLILVQLLDFGLHDEIFNEFYNQFSSHEFHPAQILELQTCFFYHSHLIKVDYEIINLNTVPEIVAKGTLPNNEVLNKYNMAEFAYWFSELSGLKFEDIYINETHRNTTLFDRHNRPLFWKLGDEPSKKFKQKSSEDMEKIISLGNATKDLLLRLKNSETIEKLNKEASIIKTKIDEISSNERKRKYHYKRLAKLCFLCASKLQSIMNLLGSSESYLLLPTSSEMNFYLSKGNESEAVYYQLKGDLQKSLICAEAGLINIKKAIRIYDANKNAFAKERKVFLKEAQPNWKSMELNLQYITAAVNFANCQKKKDLEEIDAKLGLMITAVKNYLDFMIDNSLYPSQVVLFNYVINKYRAFKSSNRAVILIGADSEKNRKKIYLLYKDSLKHFEKALEYKPKDLETLRNIHIVRSKLAKYAE